MKISIVGAGTVGVTLAYTLLPKSGVREVLLVGRNRGKAEAEAADLMHAQTFLEAPVVVRSGVLADVADSGIVVVCASAPHPKPFKDRRLLAISNAELMKSLLPEIARVAPDAKLIMVSNPVDSLTWLALQLTGFPPQRVIGTGTLVDSFRYRDLLSRDIGIHPGDLRVYILGEHGDSQFPAMSIAVAGAERIEDNEERRVLAERAKRSGMEVFEGKGNTCYAIAQATALIIRAILLDERATIPVTVRVDDYLGVRGLCLSLPAVIGSAGIVRVLHPDLSPEEQLAFRSCAKSVGETNDVIREGIGL